MLLYAVKCWLMVHLGVERTSCIDWFLQWFYQFSHFSCSIQSVTVAWFLRVKTHIWTECEKRVRSHSDCILQWYFTFLGRAWNAPDARKDYAEDHKTIVIYSTLMTFLLCGYSVEEFNHPVIFGDSTRFKALGRLHII